MAARTIVTSQPDVACDVCERRLLRGEQPDVFLAAGRRRIVCELCAPRAAFEGWLRETDAQALTLPPARARRGRSLLERLSTTFRARQTRAEDPTFDDDGGDRAGTQPEAMAPLDWDAAVEDAQSLLPTAADPAPDHDHAPPPPAAPAAVAPAARSSARLHDAVAAFNASEFPRRVAGVARSLGAPEVTVREAEHLDTVIRIVVAWELCWYRYEVDLGEPLPVAVALEQGTELAELPREDRAANAAAEDSGRLALVL